MYSVVALKLANVRKMAEKLDCESKIIYLMMGISGRNTLESKNIINLLNLYRNFVDGNL
jgi:hypothetical protein